MKADNIGEGMKAFPASYPIETRKRLERLEETMLSKDGSWQELAVLELSLDRNGVVFVTHPGLTRTSPLSAAMTAYARRESTFATIEHAASLTPRIIRSTAHACFRVQSPGPKGV